MAKSRISKTLKSKVRIQANGLCEYCLSQEKYATHAFSIDHIIPEDKAGKNDLQNLCLACQGCNNFKFTKTHAIDAETGQEVKLYNPRKNHWHDHFEWNTNFTVLMGISSIGRVTINTLKLNRDFLLNQRALYRAHGIHPPAFTLKGKKGS